MRDRVYLPVFYLQKDTKSWKIQAGNGVKQTIRGVSCVVQTQMLAWGKELGQVLTTIGGGLILKVDSMTGH